MKLITAKHELDLKADGTVNQICSKKPSGPIWYDVLSGQFFFAENCRLPDLPLTIRPPHFGNEIESFDSFGDLFTRVQGNIYNRSCFYGYRFSEEEKLRFHIREDRLNFDSFIKETIDDYNLECVEKKSRKAGEQKPNRAKEMIEWISSCETIHSTTSLSTKATEFRRLFKPVGDEEMFIALQISKNSDSIREPLIESAKKNAYDLMDYFGTILLTYGTEAADDLVSTIIERSKKGTDLRRFAKEYKKEIQNYKDGLYERRVECSFDSKSGFYIKRESYSDGKYTMFGKKSYFPSLDQLAASNEGDLKGANLSEAPDSRSDIEKYQIDSKTKLPYSACFSKCEIKKAYKNGRFMVRQTWLDEKGVPIGAKTHSFSFFFDFAHFLKGDISNSDLAYCEGIENLKGIPGLKLEGIKVRSQAAEALGIQYPAIGWREGTLKTFEVSAGSELQTLDALDVIRPFDNDYDGIVSYISDLHIPHKLEAFGAKSETDADVILMGIAHSLRNDATYTNLVAGDISGDFELFKKFIDLLGGPFKDRRIKQNYFFTLGNHELWEAKGESLNEIAEKYKNVLCDRGNVKFHLVQNNLFYFDEDWIEIAENDLSAMSPTEIKARTRGARFAIFGGIGFAGANKTFNADNGIYMGMMSREEEIEESQKFLALYEKVTTALEGRNLIVLTHMPLNDWAGREAKPKKGVVYVSGHNHRNYFFDDGSTRVYADNQVGYKGKTLRWKRLPINKGFDWFADYKDGIHEIQRNDYIKFYRGLNLPITYNRSFEKLYFVQRDGAYVFLAQDQRSRLYLLNGGAIKNVGERTPQYFYDHLPSYCTSVKRFLASYGKFQENVSEEIKRIGGIGTIHGAIVDIDFYNHLYLNPLDGKITPYFAYSMTNKYVYQNVESLLKYECPRLYENYTALIAKNSDGFALIVSDKNALTSPEKTYVASTAIYKISRILKGLQFTTNYNIVRVWNDEFADKPSESNGKLIVEGLLEIAKEE